MQSMPASTPAHHVVDALGDHRRIDLLAAEQPHRHILAAGRHRQPPGMGGADFFGAAFHGLASLCIREFGGCR
jgi:hypothetical protein